MAVNGVYFGNLTRNYGVYDLTPEQRKIIGNNNIYDRPGYRPDGTKIDPAARAKQLEAIRRILQQKGKIDPTRDKVFIDPKTGELTTIKPGLIPDPKMEEESKKRARRNVGTLIGALGALALAFVFRGKIKSGATKLYEALKPYLKTGIEKTKDLYKKGKNYIKPALTKAKDLATKGYTAVKDVVIKGKNYIVNLFKKAPVKA